MTEHIVVDVGNSRVKWGRCDERQVVEMVSLAPAPKAWEEQWQRWGKPNTPWTISGSHPEHMDEFLVWLASRRQKSRRISSCQELSLQVRVDQPDQVGLDRLLNAVAVVARCRGKGPAIIIDVGSAVTVDYVDEGGVFRGGAIYPGLRLMAQALHDHTAKLPLVEVTKAKDPPGANTIAAIEAGVFHAVLGGMELLIQAYEKHSSSPPAVFLGGGDACILAPHLSRQVILWPEMTLEGIRRTVEGPP